MNILLWFLYRLCVKVLFFKFTRCMKIKTYNLAKVSCCKFYLYFFFIWISNVTYNMSYVIDTIKRALFKTLVSVALATEVLWWPDQWCISWPAGICRETLLDMLLNLWRNNSAFTYQKKKSVNVQKRIFNIKDHCVLLAAREP